MDKNQKSELRDRGFAPLSSEWGSDKLTTTPTTLLLVFFGGRGVSKDLNTQSLTSNVGEIIAFFDLTTTPEIPLVA